MKLAQLMVLSLLFIISSCIKDESTVASSDSVDSGDPNGTGGVTQTGTDPLASKAWHLGNTGQSSYSTGHGTSGEDISVASVYELGVTGKNIRIAVSDSGTDTAHEDLAGNQLTGEHRNYDLNSSSLWAGSIPYFSGDDAHGTATVGLISAVGNNAKGSHGVAYDAKFAAFKFVTDYSASVTAASILARYVDQMDGPFDIFNYSYGYPQCLIYEDDELAFSAIKSGVTDLRGGKGALYVQSAGNSYTDTLASCLGNSTPGSFAANTNFSDDLATPERIIVGAVNADGLKSSYSTPGSGIWISAPGGEYGTTSPAMITTDISGCNHGLSRNFFYLSAFNRGALDNPGCNYTSLMNGTSSAAPVVSGVIALLLEANPSLSWRDVKHILALSADKIDFLIPDLLYHPLGLELSGYDYDLKWLENAAGISYSNWYGFGRVNALSALIMANSYTFPLGSYEETANPISNEWYYTSGTVDADIPDEDATGVSSQITVLHNFFIESVQVELTTDHPYPSDLGVSLISPSGTESRLLLVNSNVYAVAMPAGKLLMTNAFYGENSLGAWTLKVVDGLVSATGKINSWKIKINGHRITGDGSYPGPVSNISSLTSFPSLDTTPPVTFTPSTSGDVMRYEVSIGKSSGSTDISNWTSIGNSFTNIQLSGLTLELNKIYYLNVRAIDNEENSSSIRTISWKVEL